MKLIFPYVELYDQADQFYPSCSYLHVGHMYFCKEMCVSVQNWGVRKGGSI